MAQIIGWMLCFYIVLKGIEILQIGMASMREDRQKLVNIGGVTLMICCLAALLFLWLLNGQAAAVTPSPSFLP